MATVVLQYAGAALGTLVGGPLGGLIGRAIGGIAGNFVDQQLFGGGTKRSEGPRLTDLRVLASEEGAAVPVMWGRMRLSGQVIWATNLEEEAKTDTQKASSKGGPSAKSTTYSYYANLAVGLCEGEIDGVGKVWADGKLIDIASFTTRLYTGSEAQSPDSFIQSIEGATDTPAYRGLAYIVFERLPLQDFGNRVPQLSFEVLRHGNGAAELVRAVNIIPGSTEFGYDTTIVTRKSGKGKTAAENAHVSAERSDFSVAIDQLQETCKNLDAASLVVAWFGTDLRCSTCLVQPRVDNPNKVTNGGTWQVSGLTRSAATVVSQVDGAPAFGGSPSDQSVIRAIQDIHARNIDVMFYPFLLMDVPQGNSLPNPYGGTGQPAYPWRGRITCDVAPGLAGTQDKTAAAATQVAAFMGNALPSHFSTSGGVVNYTGPAEWRYRRMILHYAHLCVLAGGVETFLIGSELRGLTMLRSAAAVFPMVAALQQLAAEVKAILPGAKVSYAADWSEYFGHQPVDGSNDVYFHLDPLWSSANVDFIGIDNYMPLSDWRDGAAHLDATAGYASIYDVNYLKANVAGGEGYDWFYISSGDRNGQNRTAISDGTYGKPWVFRNKDLKNWWTNQHFNRPGGVQSGVATAWVPQSKPILFTEAGCPAIDKGTNGPNVFVDAKSSENALPPFSGGQQDDLIQNRYVKTLQEYWSAPGVHNPVSTLYAAPMVNAARIHYWAWDARPFPAFPARTDIWADGVNVARGHWLNGRMASVDLGDLIEQVTGRFGLTDVETSDVAGLVDGFVLDRPLSARDGLEGLLQSFAIDVVESDGKIKFRPRSKKPTLDFTLQQLGEISADTPLLSQTRTQETDLPRAIRIGYVESGLDYRSAAVTQQQLETASSREINLNLPAALSQSLAQSRADVALAEAWVQRTRSSFALPPSVLAIEPGDVLTVAGQQLRVQSIADGTLRKCDAINHENAVYDPAPAPARQSAVQTSQVYGQPFALLMDLATTVGDAGPWVAAQAEPWPGRLGIFKSSGAASFDFNRFVDAQATVGTLQTALSQGLQWRLDHTHAVDVLMDYGALVSVSEDELLDGKNLAAIGTPETGFEILQFLNATLIAPNTYRLTGLLRALAGSAAEMLATRLAGQNFVLLNGAVMQPIVTAEAASLPSTWRIGPQGLDHGHPAFLQLAINATLRGLRPLAPVQARARRDGAGVRLSWIRQTRSEGDSWEFAEVPLAETTESYRAEIVNAGNVVRSFSTAVPEVFYSDGEMTTDFGAPQESLTVRLAQLSAATGPGTILERILNV